VVDQHPEIRRATRDDNPFEPALQSYGLEVTTAAEPFAGTDANITFRLTGCRGQATITVDTGNVNDVPYDSRRMRDANLIDTPSAGTDWVTIPSADLGRLMSISVFNDGTGDAPGWHLVDVHVSSAGWLGPDFGGAREYRVTYDNYVDGGASTGPLPLKPDFTEPLPTIQCPAPIVLVNAPGQCSAPVMFSPTVDGMCPDVSAISSPASGSTFPVGTTTVSSYAQSASDPQSKSDPCTFTVTVHDTEAPVVTCPAPIVVNATSPAGAVVSYVPGVSDNCSVASTTCVPPAGGLFAVGDTTAACTAADAANNQASCTFNVHVKGAAEQTSDLITVVGNLATKSGTKNALLAKLTEALAKLQSNNTAAACGPLQSFINLVNAQRDKDITANDADALIAAATTIRGANGCTG
jgi:hypothetical protein